MQALARSMRVPRGAHTTWARRVAMAALCCVLWLLRLGFATLPPIGVVEYLWDGNALAGEFDPEKGARFFVHEPGTLVPMLQQEQGAVFTYVNDHLGMPKELVDQDGRVAWAAAHSAWGNVVETWRDPQAKRAVETPFRLLGQYLDGETGLCYTRFRYFDPDVGRWLSPDPLGVASGRNLFAFDGSPTANVDPLGLCTDVDPAELRFTQRTAGGKGRADALRASMGERGYDGDPIDVVRTPDGLVTVDNTRPAVALEQGISSIPANVH